MMERSNTMPTLKELVSRIRLDEKFILEHPENKEMLERHVATQKEYIVRCVLENEENPLLGQIRLKDDSGLTTP